MVRSVDVDQRAREPRHVARQLLLAVDRPILDAVAHLVGLQAQEPRTRTWPWSRLTGFDPEELGGLLAGARWCAIVVMRGHDPSRHGR